MRDCVDERLEDRTSAELGLFRPRDGLGRAHQHVPPHEVQRFGDLFVKRPSDIARIRLVVDVGALPCVADCL